VEAVLRGWGRGAAVRICDVGTGSGAIAVALAHALPLARVDGGGSFCCGAWMLRGKMRNGMGCGEGSVSRVGFAACGAGERFDVVVSNPPLCGGGEVLEAQVREYEPREALVCGANGDGDLSEADSGGLGSVGSGEDVADGDWAWAAEALAELLMGWDGVEFAGGLQGIPRRSIAQRRP